MAIKDPLMFITIEEFKNWKGFNKLEFDDTTTPDNEIWFAISVASNNIDYLNGLNYVTLIFNNPKFYRRCILLNTKRDFPKNCVFGKNLVVNWLRYTDF